MSIREAANPGSGGAETPPAPSALAGPTPVRGFIDNDSWPLNARKNWERDGGSSPAPRTVTATRRRREPARTAEVAVRRSRRVVRHVDLWSVFRFSLLLYATFLIVAAVTGIGLWVAAADAGGIGSIERFIDATFLVKNFHFQSQPILVGSLGIGAVLVFMGTCVNVLVAAFYNLISDVVGGVEITVIEEEPAQTVV